MINYTLITGAAGGLGMAFTMECVRRGQNILIVNEFHRLSRWFQKALAMPKVTF